MRTQSMKRLGRLLLCGGMGLLMLSSMVSAGNLLMTNDPVTSSSNGVSHINALAATLGHTVTGDSLANIVATPVSTLLTYDVVWVNPPIRGDVSYYNSLRSGVAAGGVLEQYVAGGGVLVICVAGNSGNQNDIAPGGVDYDRSTTHNAETFTTPAHPYITGAGYGGYALVASEFDNWGVTDHGTLVNLLGGTTTILSNTDGPSLVEYEWGCGRVLLNTLIFGFEAPPQPESGPAAENLINYADYLEPFGAAGPDNFGYLAACIPFNLRDISASGTAVVLGDDEVGTPIAIPFDFNFYGKNVSHVLISSNGFIYMGGASSNTGCCSGRVLPTADIYNGLVAGFWNDLDPTLGGTIRYQVLGTAPNRELVVGFYDIYNCCNTSKPTVTFEMILHEDSYNIELQYGSSADDGSNTSIGIENFDGSDGLQVAYGANLTLYNQAVLIWHPCPYKLAGDVNFDCIYNLVDFATSAQNWLVDCLATPSHPGCVK